MTNRSEIPGAGGRGTGTVAGPKPDAVTKFGTVRVLSTREARAVGSVLDVRGFEVAPDAVQSWVTFCGCMAEVAREIERLREKAGEA